MPKTTDRPMCEKCRKRPCERGGNGTHWRKVCSGCRRPGYSTERHRSGLSKPKRAAGVSHEQFQAMLVEQEGRCKICNQLKKLNVDHDHQTGEVRGLLCHGCNVGIGFFRDSPDLLRSAIDYLAVQEP